MSPGGLPHAVPQPLARAHLWHRGHSPAEQPTYVFVLYITFRNLWGLSEQAQRTLGSNYAGSTATPDQGEA